MRRFCNGYATIAALIESPRGKKLKLQRNVKLFLVMMGLILVVTLNFFYFHDSVAQEETTNFRAFLERMRLRQIEEAPLIIFFKFEEPLVEDEEIWGIGLPNSEIIRTIVEIGDDYVCFSELRGGAGGWRCTPFSIMSVSVS